MSGISDKIKGKAKQVEGRITGDKLREGQGSAQMTKGDLESAAARVSKRVKAGVSRMKAKIERGTSRTKRNPPTR